MKVDFMSFTRGKLELPLKFPLCTHIENSEKRECVESAAVKLLIMLLFMLCIFSWKKSQADCISQRFHGPRRAGKTSSANNKLCDDIFSFPLIHKALAVCVQAMCESERRRMMEKLCVVCIKQHNIKHKHKNIGIIHTFYVANYK